MQTSNDGNDDSTQTPLATAHVDRLKGVFAYAGSPETVGRAARAAAIEAHRVPRSENVPHSVSLSRYAFMDYSEPWRQSHPHWGIVIDEAFYHVTIDSDITKPCRPHWVGTDDDRAFDASIVVGTTILAHRQIVMALMHIAQHFGTPPFLAKCLPSVSVSLSLSHSPSRLCTGTPHSIYWHAVDFLRAAAVALCDDAPDAEAWDYVLAREDDVRAGILAVPGYPKRLQPFTAGADADAALSAQIMRSTLPDVFGQCPDDGDEGSLGSTAPSCSLF